MALVASEEAGEDAAQPLPAASTPELEESPAAEAVKPAVAETRPAREAPPEKPQIDAQGVPVAWILQVASVSSRDKANDLRDTLVAQQHKAFVKQVKRGDRTLYRVYIGPKFEKAQLESIKPAIDSAHGVNSIITRYVP
jgi:DedD protein